MMFIHQPVLRNQAKKQKKDNYEHCSTIS